MIIQYSSRRFLSRPWRTIRLCFLSFVGMSAITSAADSPGLRVFILAGQSNMEGKGAIEHLEQLLDGESSNEYSHLRDKKGWVERNDVSIKFFEKKGPLSVGYGIPANRIGPELGFGHIVGQKFDEHVLLIKTAWGGRNLAIDFRSQGAGIGNYKKRDRETKELISVPDQDYGKTYREMIAEIRDTLSHIEDFVPSGVAKNGFELSGFVFFQGFNDIINNEFSAEYEANLAHFIRDVRKDLGAPELPFVIGELGQQGTMPEKRYEEKHFRFRRGQKSVAELSEFKRTVAFVKTSPFVIKDAESFDGGYHYFGRADTFYSIGESFGTAMLLMCRDDPVKYSRKKQ